VSADKEVVNKLEEYADTHDLSDEEKAKLAAQLKEDRMMYGNAYLHMEKGRLRPSKAQELLENGEWDKE